MADDDEGLYDELYGDDDDDVPMAPPQIIPPEEPAPEEPTPAPEEPAPVAANAPGDGDGGDDDDSDDDFDIALNEPEERGSDEEPDEFMIQLDDTEQKQQLYQQQYGAEEEDAGAGDELEAQLDGMPGAAPDDAAAQSDPIHYRSKTYVRGSAPPPPAPPPGAPSNPAAARTLRHCTFPRRCLGIASNASSKRRSSDLVQRGAFDDLRRTGELRGTRRPRLLSNCRTESSERPAMWREIRRNFGP